MVRVAVILAAILSVGHLHQRPHFKEMQSPRSRLPNLRQQLL